MLSQSRGISGHIRLKNLSACLETTLQTLDIISKAFTTPDLQLISLMLQSLIKLTATVKQNRTECANLLEQTHQVLNGIISLHLKPEELTPNRLSSIGDFLGTLHKIHTFVEEQQEGSKLKIFFQPSHMHVLLKECRAGLKHMADVFKISIIGISKDVNNMKILAEERHQAVLNLIENMSDNEGSDSHSLSCTILTNFSNSSPSFTMLPPEPKIFHGRESELLAIIGLLEHPLPRVAILGPGGIGKTALAQAVLHHPEITLKYGINRFFIPCDSATTKQQLMSLIGSHLELERGIPERRLVQFLSTLPQSLMILDNLETVWEVHETRKEVEAFLSLITSPEALALIITMRGAERPAQVGWTRPFLQPLQPLSHDAALKTFLDIADGVHDSDNIAQLLALTDHMPLAVALLAHLADTEGLSTVLARWEREKTSLISLGYDQKSNLDISIALSLSSPRLNNAPGSKDLLALLSLLPDGLSDTELVESNIPITSIMGCKAALVRTSLGYTSQQRLKVLVPIREYMMASHPPALSHTEAIFYTYLPMLEHYFFNERGVGSISANFVNMQNIILFRLQHMPNDVKPTIYAALHLNSFGRFVLGTQSDISLMAHLSTSLIQPSDPRLKVCWAIYCVSSKKYTDMDGLQTVITQTLEYFPHFDDSQVKCRFYRSVGAQYTILSDLASAISWNQKALQLAISARDFREQSISLERLSWLEQSFGDHVSGLAHASEAQQLAMISGNFTEQAAALRSKAICLQWLGKYSECLIQHQRAQDILAFGGIARNFLGRVITSDLAELHNIKSEYTEAQRIMISLLATYKRTLANKPFLSVSLAEYGVEAGSSVQEVKSNIEQAARAFNQLGMKTYLIYCDIIHAALDLREGNKVASKEAFEKSFRSSLGGYNNVSTYCLEKLGNITLWDSPHISPIWPTMLLAYALRSKQKLQVYKGFQFLGDLAFIEGDQETANSLLTLALHAFTHMDVHRSRAECMLQLGNIANSNGDYPRVKELWTSARPLFVRSSQEKKVLLLDCKLADVRRVMHEEEPL